MSRRPRHGVAPPGSSALRVTASLPPVVADGYGRRAFSYAGQCRALLSDPRVRMSAHSPADVTAIITFEISSGQHASGMFFCGLCIVLFWATTSAVEEMVCAQNTMLFAFLN